MAEHDETSKKASSTFPSSMSTVTINDFTLLVNSVDTIKDNIEHLLTIGDVSAVQFHYLGIHSEDDMTSWNAINNPQNNFGIVINSHRVMKTTHHVLHSTNSLACVNTLCKLQNPSLAQGLAITAFETEFTKFFSVADGHRALKQYESLFNAMRICKE